jgi:hypothetical protein
MTAISAMRSTSVLVLLQLRHARREECVHALAERVDERQRGVVGSQRRVVGRARVAPGDGRVDRGGRRLDGAGQRARRRLEQRLEARVGRLVVRRLQPADDRRVVRLQHAARDGQVDPALQGGVALLGAEQRVERGDAAEVSSRIGSRTTIASMT